MLAIFASKKLPIILIFHKMHQKLLAIFLFLGIINICSAQPVEEETHYSGCHIHKREILSGLNAVAENFYDFNTRSDTFDILNYDIALDVTNFAGKTIYGTTTILFKAKMDGVSDINFDLEKLKVDSVTTVGGLLLNFVHVGTWLNISLPQPMAATEEYSVKVYYHGQPKTCDCGFGGFYFENGIAYNLGIGLSEIPPNNGRTWFPCFDSFKERATYDLHIRTNAGRKAYCSGDFLGEMSVGGDTILRNYRMNIQLPTYLLGIAVGNYSVIKSTYSGDYGTNPVELVVNPSQVAKAEASFSKLNDAISVFEAWYGPYIWGRVGYVGTTKGAMEHSNSIAYPDFAFDGAQTNAGLMAHELAHHWWGNISGPILPTDMWIKEGGAEYGAHLFIEKTAGRAAFEKKCRDNTRFVMKNAQADDGGYLALSPMPQPQTYGTHTYNKGALVYHNLRGYLGDTLYRHTMMAVLDSFYLRGMSAQEFRDYLTQKSGRDMNPFFNAWIFNPGYPTFEIDSVQFSGQQATMFVQQKGFHLPIFHQKVPLQAVFYAQNGQREEFIIEANGEFSTQNITLPAGFTPVWWVLNENQKLNIASFNAKKTFTTTTNTLESLAASDLQIKIDAMPTGDSAMVQVDHHWGAADPQPDAPSYFHISKNHFWRVGGLWPTGFRASASLNYNGNTTNSFLDADLVANGEDSIRLVWRPRAGESWREYYFYKKLIVGATNGFGVMRIDTLLAGDYAFANGLYSPITAADEPQKTVNLVKIFPNPATDFLNIESENGLLLNDFLVEIFDESGRLLLSEKGAKSLKINELAAGNHILKVTDFSKKVSQELKFVKR
jgi:Peptidase family M1 domain/Peptidase M1 N-terminal domain/Secretion system C-terminal sorting domain